MSRHIKYLYGMPTIDIHAYLSEYPAVDISELEKRLKQPFGHLSRKKVMSFELDGIELYPLFQLDKSGQVHPIIEDVVGLLYPTVSPAVAYTFLCEDYAQLGGSIADNLSNERLHITILSVLDSISRPDR